MKGRVLRYTQAKVIGGGSSINAQIYTRGNARDYDAWAQRGGLRRLGLPRRAALFQARRGQPALRQRLPWLWRAARRLHADRAAADLRRLFPRRRRRWASPSIPTSTARGRKASATTSSPSAMRRRSSASVAYLEPIRDAQEPHHPDRRAGDAHRHREGPRHRRRDRRQAGGRDEILRAEREVHRLLRRHRLAEAAACNRASARPII